MKTASSDRQKRATFLFIAGFIAASAAHVVDRILNMLVLDPAAEGASAYLAHFSTALFVLNITIYIALLIVWMTSVRARLLPSAGRTYIVISAYLMFFFLTQRAVKYRLAMHGTFLEHALWYTFYIPLAMIPALFLLTCIDMGTRGKARTVMKRTVWALSALLTAGVLTNDLHRLMFRPIGDRVQGGGWDTYTNGPLWYVFYAFVFLCILAGVVLLARIDRRKSGRHVLLPVLLLLLMFVVMVVPDRILGSNVFPFPWAFPEAAVFSMLGIFESCIRSRLIPYNENYTEFFRKLKLPALITDEKLDPVFESASAVCASREGLERSIDAPCEISDGVYLNGRRITSGISFWISDRTVMKKLSEELEDVIETLEGENDLLIYENKQKEEVARVDARNRVYAKAASEVYPTQKKISSVLDEVGPGTPEYAEKLAKALVLFAYVKRKTNFVLSSEERDTVGAEELYLALDESARYLSLGGVKASVALSASRDFSNEEASSLYDTFELIAESLYGKAEWLMTTLIDSGIRIMTGADAQPSLDGAPADVSLTSEDGQLFITVTPREGGDAE